MYLNMKELIENEALRPFFKAPTPGEIIKGKIIGKEKSALFLDLGNFGTGIVGGKEFFQAKNILREVKVGDEISAKVLALDSDDGFVKLSIIKAKEETAWLRLKEKKDKDENFSVKIKKANKGGLMTDIEGIPAFLPVSQLSIEHYPKVEDGNQAEILKKLQKFIGQELKVKIIGLDQKQKALVLSEKAAMLGDQIETLKNYKVGDIVEGKITGITDFGIFIKFPLDAQKPEEILEGLIHISELDWQLITDPGELFKINETVRAKIIKISNGKISLSLKALKKDPWQNLKYKKGETVEGEVVKFNPFGVFVKIKPTSPKESEIQALCHISEFKNEEEMKKILKIGEKYQFQIFSIIPEEHKMILKLASRG